MDIYTKILIAMALITTIIILVIPITLSLIVLGAFILDLIDELLGK